MIVGFDRKIKGEWLDALADQAAKGEGITALRQYLHGLLKDDHPADTARGKTVTVLMRIWVHLPPEHLPIREQAFDLLKKIRAGDRIWLHWGMCMLAYPLFRDTATAIGRLLRLQDDSTLSQLQRRLVDAWGERSTVKRASQRVVRSMVDWHTLANIDGPGHFTVAPKLTTHSKALQLWFLWASHAAAEAEIVEATQLLDLPSMFPFKLTVGKMDLRRSPHFTLHRQGLDMEMVEITNTPSQREKGTNTKKVSENRLLFEEDGSSKSRGIRCPR